MRIKLGHTRVWALGFAAICSCLTGMFVAVGMLGNGGPALLSFGVGLCAAVLLAYQAWLAQRARAAADERGPRGESGAGHQDGC